MIEETRITHGEEATVIELELKGGIEAVVKLPPMASSMASKKLRAVAEAVEP